MQKSTKFALNFDFDWNLQKSVLAVLRFELRRAFPGAAVVRGFLGPLVLEKEAVVFVTLI